MATPLEIEIALHYHCCYGDFGRMHAPACRAAVEDFVSRGLLRRSDAQDREFEPTPGLAVYVEALCAVPFPLRAWAMPTTMPTELQPGVVVIPGSRDGAGDAHYPDAFVETRRAR